MPLVVFFKGYVHPHDRRLPDGRVVRVEGYTDKRTKKQEAGSGQLDMFAEPPPAPPAEPTVEDLNRELASLTDSEDSPDDFFERMARRIDVQKKLAQKLGEEKGGVVLVQTRSAGKPMGAFISPEPDNSGRWRITWFDERGFSGDTQRDTKEAAVRDALTEGYRDTNRNLLREVMALPSFQEGNEATEAIRRENEQRAAAAKPGRFSHARETGFPVGGYYAVDEHGETMRGDAKYGELPPRFKTLEAAERFGAKQDRKNGHDKPADSGPIAGLPDDARPAQDGKPTTETAAFKKWFAGSKVVDGEGKPLRVYHGSLESFTEFKLESEKRRAFNFNRIGYWFDVGAETPSFFAGEGKLEGGNVMPVYLSIKNPLVIKSGPMSTAEKAAIKKRIAADKKATRWHEVKWKGAGEVLKDTKRFDSFDRLLLLLGGPSASDEEVDKCQAALIAKGYDGIHLVDTTADEGTRGDKATDWWIAFRPEQIKSATANAGTFDPENPDMTKAAPVVVLLKSYVHPYDRRGPDGQMVHVAGHTDHRVKRRRGDERQMDMFPAAAPKPPPFSPEVSEHPERYTIDMFSGETQAEHDAHAPPPAEPKGDKHLQEKYAENSEWVGQKVDVPMFDGEMKEGVVLSATGGKAQVRAGGSILTVPTSSIESHGDGEPLKGVGVEALQYAKDNLLQNSPEWEVADALHWQMTGGNMKISTELMGYLEKAPAPAIWRLIRQTTEAVERASNGGDVRRAAHWAALAHMMPYDELSEKLNGGEDALRRAVHKEWLHRGDELEEQYAERFKKETGKDPAEVTLAQFMNHFKPPQNKAGWAWSAHHTASIFAHALGETIHPENVKTYQFGRTGRSMKKEAIEERRAEREKAKQAKLAAAAMSRQEITDAVLKIKPDGFDVIGDLAVSREGDKYFVEGAKNRRFSWNQAVDAIQRKLQAKRKS